METAARQRKPHFKPHDGGRPDQHQGCRDSKQVQQEQNGVHSAGNVFNEDARNG
jgi:hypothetical protein